jgi:AraC-like DNA-binding protein/ligand-binding sensor protein
MPKLNIIQRREIDPLILKALKIVKHYEKALNCIVSVMGPELNTEKNTPSMICRRCNLDAANRTEKKCEYLHTEAVNKARQLGGSYIYVCSKGYVFWTSPFYSGERFAGAFFSGGVRKSEKNNNRIKALAHIMLLCADQISGKSFIQKNVAKYVNENSSAEQLKTYDEKENGSYSCVMDMERMLLACLRRGDNIEGQKILVDLLKIIYLEVRNKFQADHRTEAFRLKALELAVLLSRAVADPEDIKDNSTLETTNRCLKMVEESSNFDEITGILSSITEKISGKIFSFHGVRHFSALRKAERYIWMHYTRKLSLKEIANASGLSAPYFSTVFKDEMGENLSNYLNRLRVEKATMLLVTTNVPISEIAVTCGFEDQSWFSKIFKSNTGLTPGKYRERGITAGGMSAEVTTVGR